MPHQRRRTREYQVTSLIKKNIYFSHAKIIIESIIDQIIMLKVISIFDEYLRP
jgi:hypothetical protein